MKPVRVFLVGESNPHGDDPRAALYPYPPNSAGYRLCRDILGMRERDYLRSFERRNLISSSEKWSAASARWTAAEILREADGVKDPLVVALGRRVAGAFGAGDPFACVVRHAHFPSMCADHQMARIRVLHLPHPSGRCRTWNDRKNKYFAQEALAAHAPEIAPLLDIIIKEEK